MPWMSRRPRCVRKTGSWPLGPKMLELARDRSAGAHPYLTTPRHTGEARATLGSGPLLAPEQMVVLDPDLTTARATARHALARYLALPNYSNNLKRLGFGDADLADGGSDRLVDGIVACGDIAAIAAGQRTPGGRGRPRVPAGAHRHAGRLSHRAVARADRHRLRSEFLITGISSWWLVESVGTIRRASSRSRKAPLAAASMAVQAMASAPSRSGGIGRCGDAGGGELRLVVDRSAGVDADQRVDGGDGQRDVGHVGGEGGQRGAPRRRG